MLSGVDNWGDDGVSADWVIGRFTSVLGPRLTNEVRFQWGRDFEFQTSQAAIPGEPVVPGTTRSPDVLSAAPSRSSSASRTSSNGGRIPTSAGSRLPTPPRCCGTRISSSSASTSTGRMTRWTICSRRAASTPTSPARDFISDYELNTKLGGTGRFYSTFASGYRTHRFQFRDHGLRGVHPGHLARPAERDGQLGPAVRPRVDAELRRSLTRSNRGPACSPATRTTGDRASASTGTSPARATRFSAEDTACSTAASSTRRSPTPSPTPGGGRPASAVDQPVGRRARVSEHPRERVREPVRPRHRLLRQRHAEPADSPVRHHFRSADRRQHRPLRVVRRKPGPEPADLHRSEPESADRRPTPTRSAAGRSTGSGSRCRCSRRHGRTPTSRG